MGNPVCYNCPDRRAGTETTPGCHTTCEKYAVWKAEWEARKAQDRAKARIETMDFCKRLGRVAR